MALNRKDTEKLKAARAKLQATAKAAEAAGEADTRAMARLAEAMTKAFGQKHDPSGSPVGNYYGQGGLFSNPYTRPEMFSAVQQPMSLWSMFPMQKSLIQNDVTAVLTAAGAATGANPADVCGIPPVPGELLACNVWLPFGQYFAGSNVIDVSKVGMLDTYGVQPREIVNLVNSQGWFVPETLRMGGANLESEPAIQQFKLATMLARQGATVEIDGNAALPYNASELGWIREPQGLSRLIKDGYTDVSGTACPALDSVVLDWNAAVDAPSSAEYAGNISAAIHDLIFALNTRASEVGMGDTKFVIVMNQQLFRAITFVFACTYALSRCGDATDGNPITREMAVIEARQNEMQRGQYLLVGGVPYPVAFTSGYEVNGTGTLTDSIYVVPLRGAGRDLTYLQYFPMDNPAALEYNRMNNTTGRFFSNNGMFLFGVRSSALCDQWVVTYRPRLKLETPFLAGRIDNVQFASFIGFRSPFPGNSSYVGGGTSYFNAAPQGYPS